SAFPGVFNFFRLDPARDPKRIDFTFRIAGPGSGRVRDTTSPCIYKFDADKLWIVFGDTALGERPGSFEWSGPRSPFVHLVLRRPNEEERKKQEQSDGSELEGTWIGLTETVRGEERSALKDLRLVVRGKRLRFDQPGSDPLYATFTVDVADSPWHIDL